MSYCFQQNDSGKQFKVKKKGGGASFFMCRLLSSDIGFFYLYKNSILNYTPTTGMVSSILF